MLYYLENEKVKAGISDLGAELKTLYGKNTGFEYIWAGHPDYWKNSATILFPICGRLYGGKYTYKNKEYEMKLHGIAQNQTFRICEHNSEKIVFEISETPETLKIYPFKFNFRVTYSLNGATVRTEYTVKNTGNPELPFSVGGHPGFNVPLEEGLDFTDHYLEFDKAEKRTRIDMSQTCFYIGKDVDYPLEDDKILRLNHSLFKNDAIFLSANNGSVTLKSDKSARWVKVSYSNITHIGFWQTYASDTPFICIEPWHGIPSYDGITDDFATKNEFIHLADGEKYNFAFDISVSE